MYRLRQKDERGKTETGWLDSSHTFSFAEYYDPMYMGFSDLRVINDDIVAPKGGFSLHRHDNMEIISIVLSGQLEHKDSVGNTSILKPYEIQKMTAGTGILHSEYNPSLAEPVHFLQIWIMPDKMNLPPSYEQMQLDKNKMKNKLLLLVSQDARNGSVKINQDAELYQTVIEADKIIRYELEQDRKYWIQIASGAIEINSQILVEGDGLAIAKESGTIEIKGVAEESNVLLFNLAQ